MTLRRPESRLPMEAAAIPLPRPESTPPVTTMYLQLALRGLDTVHTFLEIARPRVSKPIIAKVGSPKPLLSAVPRRGQHARMSRGCRVADDPLSPDRATAWRAER